MSATVNGYIH